MTITALSVTTPPVAVKVMDLHVIYLDLQFFLIKKNVFGPAQTTMNVRKPLAALNVIYIRVFVGSRAMTLPTVEVTVIALLDFVIHVYRMGVNVTRSFLSGAAQELVTPTANAHLFSLFDRTFSPKLLVGFAVLMASAYFL